MILDEDGVVYECPECESLNLVVLEEDAYDEDYDRCWCKSCGTEFRRWEAN